MFETHTSTTYDEAFARARRERAEAFRAMFSFFRLPSARPLRGMRAA
ncbi:hypothetical protein [Jannaschia pohangensis]|uniref:Uncharacterized protein n=1 Tax=Jannaschia pohangensis TaxID=390807 RepID=A0A1I3MS05_9RHOB|nr:hypothetical protein [Jannaschia pohangensis]SFI99904.1 hypothetical protein SAMN04488095_1942 [Jannaschia pohangensis]